MPFTTGWEYTLAEIGALLGAGMGGFLPSRSGRVVAGCFRSDLNPNAPEVILVGEGPVMQRRAEQFSRQSEPVPVFLKVAANRWRHVGCYRVVDRSFDPEVIAEHARRSNRSDISQALFLQAVDGDGGGRRKTKNGPPQKRSGPPG